MASSSTQLSSSCDPCKRDGKDKKAWWHCGKCSEYMCQQCATVHGRLGISVDHEAQAVGQGSSTSTHLPSACNPCERDGKSSKAWWHCNECSEYMCQQCATVHRRLSVSVDHETLELGQERSEGLEDKIACKTISGAHRQGSKRDLGIEGIGKGNKTAEQGKGTEELVKNLNDINLAGSSGTKQPSPASISSSCRHKTSSNAMVTNQFDASDDTDDKPCYISDILVMKNHILIADFDNNKVKAFDTDEPTLVFHEHVEDAAALADVNTDTIAVSSGEKRYFTLFSLKKFGMTMIRKINTPFWCWGICHHNGLIYVVCKEDEKGVAEIDVFTIDGKHKKRLEPLFQGRKILRRPDYITVNHLTGTLYVGDFDTSAVVALMPSGKVLFNQTVQTCDGVEGVAVDDQGQLYVCGHTSNNVIRMSADGKKSEVLISDDIWGPECVNVHGKELFLCCRNSNIVKIFMLS